jgi:uracil-DNA glycosylase
VTAKPGGGRGELDRLVARIGRCRACIDQPKGAPLPHEPRPVLRVSPTARVVIAGQAPGTLVHRTGLPFNDPSGDRLRDWMGVDRDTFYDQTRIAIVPMGFCFPGQDHRGADLPPRRECASLWHRRLFAALPQLELVLAVGSYAQGFHLGDAAGKTLQATMLGWRKHLKRKGRPRVLPLPHPSWRNNGWLKDNPWFEDELLPALRREVRTLL